MVPQSKGKIYLSTERGLNELPSYRSYNTFNFGRFYNEHKTPFGNLYVLNEDTLAGGHSVTMSVEEDSDIILIPVVGAVRCNDVIISAGQARVLSLKAGSSFSVFNPYEEELVKFLQIWIKGSTTSKPIGLSKLIDLSKLINSSKEIDLSKGIDLSKEMNSFKSIGSSELIDFDLDKKKNQLIELCKGVMIGKFTGREEAVYTLAHPGNGVFAFVIEGVFEVQYRLLNAGDSLGLMEIEEVELEALSNNAIILIIDIACL